MFNDRTIFVFYEHDSLIFCPVLHFLALTLKDDAFKSEHVRCLEDIYGFHIPKPKTSLQLCWKESMKDVPIFRQAEQTLEGMCTSSTRALPYDTFLQHLSRLGKSAGFCDPLTPYCLQRGAGNAVNGLF